MCPFWYNKKRYSLPDRESNPGLPRDRRRSSPLDYRGIVANLREMKNFEGKLLMYWLSFYFASGWTLSRHNFAQPLGWNLMPLWPAEEKNGRRRRKKTKQQKKINSFEPDLNQWPMDVCSQVLQLQSTALPTELSKVFDSAVIWEPFSRALPHNLWKVEHKWIKYLLVTCLTTQGM